MNIGLIDVDGHSKFPNIPLMKLARWHKNRGDNVEFYSVFGNYDIVYMGKVFTFTNDYRYTMPNAKKIVRGGTGYDYKIKLPEEVDQLQPDYTIYPFIDKRTAYGKLTVGCPNKCSWCIVPKKEGMIKPYMDIEEIAIDGRNKIVLIDNNLLAVNDYAMMQFEKIIRYGYRIDLNQANDARLMTRETAKIMSQVKWINNLIRFGCDTKAQIEPCLKALEWLCEFGFRGQVEMYTMIHGNLHECYERISFWRKVNFKGITVRCQSQPKLDFTKSRQNIPRWAKDMARWSNRKELYASFDFRDYIPRKGFTCSEYFKNGNLMYDSM